MEFAHAKKEQVYFGDFLETICIFKPTLKLAYCNSQFRQTYKGGAFWFLKTICWRNLSSTSRLSKALICWIWNFIFHKSAKSLKFSTLAALLLIINTSLLPLIFQAYPMGFSSSVENVKLPYDNLCGLARKFYWIIKWGELTWLPYPPPFPIQWWLMCGRVCLVLKHFAVIFAPDSGISSGSEYVSINLTSGNFLRQAQHKYLKIKSHPRRT